MLVSVDGKHRTHRTYALKVISKLSILIHQSRLVDIKNIQILSLIYCQFLGQFPLYLALNPCQNNLCLKMF